MRAPRPGRRSATPARILTRLRRTLWPKIVDAELQRRLLLERARIFFVFGGLACALFYGIDRVIGIVPDSVCLPIRSLNSAFFFLSFFSLFNKFGQRYCSVISISSVVVTSALISYLASYSGGFSSPYFAGDILPMLAVPFFPWAGLLLPALGCLLVTVGYVVINMSMHGASMAMLTPVANLLGAAQIIVLATILMEHTRNRELVQRIALRHRTRELEKATLALHGANSTLSAMLDAVDQGFLIFDKNGVCLPQFSKACLSLLEQAPAGKRIESVLKLPPTQAKTFNEWREAAFRPKMDFEVLRGLAHPRFDHSQHRSILLNYFPIYGEQNTLDEVVLVATDKTEEEAQARALQAERVRGAMIVKILKSKSEFLSLCRMSFEKIAEYRKRLAESSLEPSSDTVAGFTRFLHTIKGGCSMLVMDSIVELTHRMESDWKLKAEASASDGKTRDLRELMGSQLSTLHDALQSFQQANHELIQVLGGTEEQVRDVPLSVLRTYEDFLRATFGNGSPALLKFQEWFNKKSAEEIFAPFEDETFRLAQMLRKEVLPFAIEGEGIRLDSRRLEDLLSTLIHIFRNIVDHGIEEPEERKARGKAPQGLIKIRLSRFHQKTPEATSWVRLDIADDGRGLEPAKIAESLQRKGQAHLLVGKSDVEIIQLIFQPGFSTKDQVTTLSGRGVGMDAVAHEVRRLGGKISVSSVIGQGSVLSIEFPES
jgi:two-component system chemotaxis sensor kinase CheA